MIQSHFVEWRGKPVSSVKTAFNRAVKEFRVSTANGNVTPHTLRHTAATWLMQQGVDIWQASGFLGMSPQVLINTYGHHHPDYMGQAAAAISRKDRKENVSVVKSVVDLNWRRQLLK